MDYKNVNELLEKYFEGETSLQEEAKLAEYFNQNEVSADLQQYQPLFQYFKEEKEIQLSDDFENRLLEKMKTEPKIRHISWGSKVRRYAAIAVILFGCFMAYQQMNKVEMVEDKFAKYDAKTEKEAYERTKAALLLISSKLNKTTEKAAKGFIEVRNATNKARLKN